LYTTLIATNQAKNDHAKRNIFSQKISLIYLAAVINWQIKALPEMASKNSNFSKMLYYNYL